MARSACNLPRFVFNIPIPIPIPTFKLPKLTFDLGFNPNIPCPLD